MSDKKTSKSSGAKNIQKGKSLKLNVPKMKNPPPPPKKK